MSLIPYGEIVKLPCLAGSDASLVYHGMVSWGTFELVYLMRDSSCDLTPTHLHHYYKKHHTPIPCGHDTLHSLHARPTNTVERKMGHTHTSRYSG